MFWGASADLTARTPLLTDWLVLHGPHLKWHTSQHSAADVTHNNLTDTF